MQFLPFEDALAVARSLGLNGQKDWEAWSKSGARPASLPARPDRAYEHRGWQGWAHWFGQEKVAVTGVVSAVSTIRKRQARAEPSVRKAKRARGTK